MSKQVYIAAGTVFAVGALAMPFFEALGVMTMGVALIMGATAFVMEG